MPTIRRELLPDHSVSWRLVAAVALLSACSRAIAPTPPVTRVTVAIDTIQGVAVEDRYRWLERQDDPEVRSWIESQRLYAERILGPTSPARDSLQRRLRALLDVPAASAPRRAGDWEYFTLRRVGEDVGAIYRRRWTGTATPVPPDGAYEMVLSPLPLRPDGTTSLGIEAISNDGRLLLYSVRDGGADEVTMRVRDLQAGRDLVDSLPWALYDSPSFAPDGKGIYYVHRSRSIGPRYRFHLLGSNIDSDSMLFGDGLSPTAFLGVSSAIDGRYRIYTIGHGWARNEVILQDTQSGSIIDLTRGLDAHFSPQVMDGKLWLRTDWHASRGRILVMDFAHPAQSDWRVVIPEGADVIDAVSLIDGKLYVTYVHNVAHRIRIFTKDGAADGELAVPDFSSVTLRGVGAGSALLTVTSFTQPSITYRVDLASGARTVWQAPTVTFDTSALEVSQAWYRSKDGTRAPLYIVQRRGHARGASTPALLTGYGGFAVSLLPRFDARAALWAERGGIFVQATLRGGNEFGETWHKDGMLGNKQHVFDDFISAGQFLVDSGYTSKEKLAIRGVSNGGLLMGAAITQRPDLFRAAFVGFPDLDIVRFPWFSASNNAPALLEYGDARRADQYAAIRAFSPYQNVRDGVRYPAVFVQTGMNDTRVPPWQARRFSARLQSATSSGLPVILIHDFRSGHAGGRSMSGNVQLATQEMEFLLRQLRALP